MSDVHPASAAAWRKCCGSCSMVTGGSGLRGSETVVSKVFSIRVSWPVEPTSGYRKLVAHTPGSRVKLSAGKMVGQAGTCPAIGVRNYCISPMVTHPVTDGKYSRGDTCLPAAPGGF